MTGRVTGHLFLFYHLIIKILTNVNVCDIYKLFQGYIQYPTQIQGDSATKSKLKNLDKKGVIIIENLDAFVPTNDYVFKRIFGRVGNEIITKGLLNAILDTKVKEIKLNENTILNEENVGNEKVGILDIKATLNNEITCDIEMQMINQDNLEERLLFYWSKMYIGNIHKGESYTVLKKCIGILIANFELHHLKSISKGHTEWKLRERDFSKIVLTEVCEIHIIELPKLKELVKEDNLLQEEKELKNWAKFLLTPEELEVIDMENNEAIKKAKEEFEALKQDGKEQYLAELRMKHILDTNNIKQTGYRIGMEEGKKAGIKAGREEGRKEGRKEGEKETKKKIAKEMLENGEKIEKIMKYTGLTEEEIGELR